MPSNVVPSWSCTAPHNASSSWRDACRDATAEHATARLGGRGEVVRIDARNVGRARAAGTGAVLARFGGRRYADLTG